MPRRKRICEANLTYHTTSRCIDKKHLMKPAKMKELMIRVLAATLEKYCFELNEYTIMDNHFHFFIKTVNGGASISRIMQFIKSQFARQYNREMGRTGPFWNERFHDRIVEMSKKRGITFLTKYTYIGFNPVRTGYVKDPRDYKYSSYRCYFEKNYKSPVKITHHEYFLRLGNNFEERAKKLLEFEEMYRKRIFPESMFS